MFLPLTPVVAAVRAVAALAVTTASMSGHSNLAHSHVVVSRAALAFLAVLACSWLSDRRSTFLLGATVAQLLIHGSLQFDQPGMLVFHVSSALVASGVAWHFEELWLASMHALQPLLQTLRIAPPAIPVSLAGLLCIPWRNPLRTLVRIHSLSRRGPPALALF